jgi:hypothetical protein
MNPDELELVELREGLEKAFDYRGVRATPYNRPPGLFFRS